MKRSAALILLIALLLVSLFSCGKAKDFISCRALLSAMTEKEVALPAGRYYSASSPEGDREYLSHSLISSLFGGGSYPKAAEDWIDCALYLSLGEAPCEFAVAFCQSRDAAEDTARLFLSRVSAIKAAGIELTETDYTVAVVGNYAVMVISRDPSAAMAVVRDAIIRRHVPRSNIKR